MYHIKKSDRSKKIKPNQNITFSYFLVARIQYLTATQRRRGSFRFTSVTVCGQLALGQAWKGRGSREGSCLCHGSQEGDKSFLVTPPGTGLFQPDPPQQRVSCIIPHNLVTFQKPYYEYTRPLGDILDLTRNKCQTPHFKELVILFSLCRKNHVCRGYFQSLCVFLFLLSDQTAILHYNLFT